MGEAAGLESPNAVKAEDRETPDGEIETSETEVRVNTGSERTRQDTCLGTGFRAGQTEC